MPMNIPFLGAQTPSFQTALGYTQAIQDPMQRQRALDLQAQIAQAQQKQAQNRALMQMGQTMLQQFGPGAQRQQQDPFSQAVTSGVEEQIFARKLPRTRESVSQIHKEKNLQAANKAAIKEFNSLRKSLGKAVDSVEREAALGIVRRDFPETIKAFEPDPSLKGSSALRGFTSRLTGGIGTKMPRLREGESKNVNMGMLRHLIVAKHQNPFKFPQQQGVPVQQQQAPQMPLAQPVQAAPQQIRVRLKQTGQTGTIEANEWDPNLYERI